MSSVKTYSKQYFDICSHKIHCGKEPTIAQYDEIESSAKFDLFDYSHCSPTEDQIDINEFLLTQKTADTKILHIGVGNSSIANLIENAKLIKGVTISENELSLSKSFNSSYYQVELLNKYSADFDTFVKNEKFDFIIDNNIASFVCCQNHFLRYMSNLKNSLSNNGMIVTHWLGMQWILQSGIEKTDECWRLDENDLLYIASYFNLRLNNFHPIYTLTKI